MAQFIQYSCFMMYKQQTIFSAFRHAFNGLWYFFLHERNGKVQCTAAVCAIGCGWLLAITAAHWICIFLCIGAVLSLEMMNNALEKLCDVVQEEYHPSIKRIKGVHHCFCCIAVHHLFDYKVIDVC